MSDIEEAYRTLGLKMGASIKEVREAHRDLCLVWDASRFDDNPQVQKKALDQLGRIDEAFQTLRADHGGTAKIEGETGQRPPLEEDAVQPTDRAGNSDQGAPSLYEEIFQGKKDETQRRIPIGWIIAVMMGLVVAVIYLGGPADEDEVEGPPSAPAIEEPLEMEGPIENAGSRPGDLPSDPLHFDGQSDLTEAMVETTSDGIEPAGSSPGSPADTPLKGEADSDPLPENASVVDTAKTEVPVVEPEELEPNTRPVLEREELNLVDEATEPTGQEVLEDEGSNRAVEILKEKSVLARQLMEGEGVLDLSFQEWKTVRRNAPEFWIDVVTYRTTDQGELHLIWSVNIDTGVVRALSQAARDVEPAPLPDPEC